MEKYGCMLTLLALIFPDRSPLASVTVGPTVLGQADLLPALGSDILKCLWLLHRWIIAAYYIIGYQKKLNLLLDVNPTSSEIRKRQKWIKYPGVSLRSTSLKSMATRYSRSG